MLINFTFTAISWSVGQSVNYYNIMRIDDDRYTTYVHNHITSMNSTKNDNDE